MKSLRITSSCLNKSKMVTFDVSEEVADYFIELFRKRNETEEPQISVEGNAAMHVRISILHSEQKF